MSIMKSKLLSILPYVQDIQSSHSQPEARGPSGALREPSSGRGTENVISLVIFNAFFNFVFFIKINLNKSQ